jgi:cyclopropane-fatty-acyl-phospholipid synthase
VDFIQKHIFPGSLLLSIDRVSELVRREESGLSSWTRLEEFGLGYARTLRHRLVQAFEAKPGEGGAPRWASTGASIRSSRLYFRYCRAAFAHRDVGVVQAVYVRPNRKG